MPNSAICMSYTITRRYCQIAEFLMAKTPSIIIFRWLGYHQLDKVKYFYRLAGYEKEWQNNWVSNSKVNYSSLPAGNYDVRIRNRCSNVNNFTPFSMVYNFNIPAAKNLVEEIENEVKIFPNPVINVLNIELESKIQSILGAKLLDMTGRIMYDHNFLMKEGLHSMTIDMQAFANGSYLLQIYENGKLTSNTKVQKLK